MKTAGTRRAGAELALLVVLAAACAGGNPVAPSTAQAPGSSSATTPGAGQASSQPTTDVAGGVPTPVAGVPTPDAGAPGASIDSCALLSDADLLAATGRPVALRQVSHLTRLFPSVCDIELDDGGSLTVSIMPTGGRLIYETSFEPFIGDGENPPLDRAVEGLGDKAGISGTDGLMVLSSDVLFDLFYINARRPDTEQMLRYMAAIILSKLPCIANGCPAYSPPPPLPTPEVVDMCALLTPDEIEAAVGIATLPTEPPGSVNAGCRWPLKGEIAGLDYVELTVRATGGRAEFDLYATAYEPPLEHVPDIGDDAIKTGTIPGGNVYSVIGDRLVTLKFSVPLSIDDPYELVVPLLRTAVSRLT